MEEDEVLDMGLVGKHWQLEVTALVGSSQYPRDRVLWILLEHDGKMERSRLRAKAAMRYSQLNPILDELVKEGWIRISGEMISLA